MRNGLKTFMVRTAKSN